MAQQCCIRQHGSSRKRLTIALLLGLTYLVVAAIGSALSGSLTLLAGAGHMMFHNGAIIVGLIATTVAMKTANEHFSAGYNKVEALGGYTNSIILMVISGMIIFEATADSHEGHAHAELGSFIQIEKFISGEEHHDNHAEDGHDDHAHGDHADDHKAIAETVTTEEHRDEHDHDAHNDHGHQINPTITAFVAVIGLVLHLIGAFVLYGGRNENLCVKGAYLCIFYDVAGIFVAFAVSASAYFVDFHDLDIYGAIAVAVMLFVAAIRLMKQSIYQVMDGTPENIKYADVVTELQSIDHIVDVHDVIIRNLGGGQISISAHLVMKDDCIKAGHWETCRTEAENKLSEKFGATNCTLQLECAKECDHAHH